MKQTDRRNGVERRVPTTFNSTPPYLTKQGPVLYNRRRDLDRRHEAELEIRVEAQAKVAE